MNLDRTPILLLLLTALFAPALANRDCEAAPTGVVEVGDFALYVPTEVQTVRGILLLLGGPDTRAFGTGGPFGAPIPELEESLQDLGHALRTLAGRHGLALLGTGRQGRAELPNQTETDRLILEALDEAARRGNRPELTRAPIFVYGISGGSLQAAGFAARHPGRVGALLLKVPGPPELLDRAEALATPTYLLLAEHDSIADNRAVIATFEANRRAGGLWAMAVEPGVPHHSLTPGHSALTVNWLSAVLELRLGASPQDPLRAVPESAGWLGHPDYGVAEWADYSGDRRAASWLPNRATAEEWWEFTGGKNQRP